MSGEKNFVLNLITRTWIRDSHGLYDYESTQTKNLNAVLADSVIIVRRRNEIKTIANLSELTDEEMLINVQYFPKDKYIDWRLGDETKGWVKDINRARDDKIDIAGESVNFKKEETNLRTEFREYVTNADLISYDLGVNDFSIYLSNMLTSIINNPSEPYYSNDVHTLLSDDEAYLYFAAKGFLEVTAYTLLDNQIDSKTRDIIDGLLDSLCYAFAGFVKGFNRSMEVIYDLNPDVQVVVVGIQNLLDSTKINFLGVELDECNIVRFADGEVNLNVKETVRGHHCFIVQSTSNPVNENYMELFIMIDALKRASAKTINVIMPYYGYARQDRKALARQPISARLMADLLTVAGATRVLSMDLHAAQIQGFFNIPIDNLVALPVFTAYFKKQNIPDLVVVSPDHGGATRARNFAVNFDNAPLAIIDKRRSRPNVVESMTVIGDVKDKNVVIVDDLIDTAGTLVSAINVLKEAGAKDIYMCATHAVLSGPAIERIQNSQLKELIVTNTIELSESKKISKIKQLSVSKMIGNTILNILDNKAISDLFVYKPDEE